MHRMLAELVKHIDRRIDHERAPYVPIAAGVVYLVAFNTVLRAPNLAYFAFMLLVAVLCVPVLVHAREPSMDEGAESERHLAFMGMD